MFFDVYIKFRNKLRALTGDYLAIDICVNLEY